MREIVTCIYLFKEFPFKGNSNFSLFNNIKSNINKMKETKNNELNKLLKKMLIIDPNKRISFNDYFNDVFFQQQNYIICECNINSKDINKLIQICQNWLEVTDSEFIFDPDYYVIT